MRRERILRAARERFESQGFRNTTVAEIAGEAGVAQGTIYVHFESKEDLFLHLIDRDNADWGERAGQVLSGPGTALERLANLSRASAEFYAHSRLLLAVLRRDRRLIHPPLLEDVHSRLAGEITSLLARVVREGIDEGSIRPVDPEKAAAVLFAAGHALFEQSDHSYEELSEVLADVAIRGLAARPPRRSAARGRRGVS